MYNDSICLHQIHFSDVVYNEKNMFIRNIVVKNLSINGLEFVSMDVDKFEIDDEITVSFKLDNEERTTIKKTVGIAIRPFIGNILALPGGPA